MVRCPRVVLELVPTLATQVLTGWSQAGSVRNDYEECRTYWISLSNDFAQTEFNRRLTEGNLMTETVEFVR